MSVVEMYKNKFNFKLTYRNRQVIRNTDREHLMLILRHTYNTDEIFLCKKRNIAIQKST